MLTFAVSNSSAEKPAAAGLINIDVRLCKECRATLFDRRDFEADLTRETPDLKVYGNLIQFERGIRLLMPRFQKLLTALQYVYQHTLLVICLIVSV